jgi:hypothetical protein
MGLGKMTMHTAARQQAGDLAAIQQAALDYLQGWYEGDAQRVRRSLHPQLAKRAIKRDIQTGEQRFHHVSREQLVALTQQGGGADTPSDERYYDIAILDVYGDIACVRADSCDYVDYLHLARCEGAWLIVNVLFDYRPPRQ